MAANSQPRLDEYRQYLYNRVLVKRSRLLVRNRETRMWSLVAKRDLPRGTFVGFYTGAMDRNECPESYYALDMGPGAPCIVPFADEQRITPFERDRHVLASMNEPVQGEHANCDMVPQDYSHAEIDNVQAIANHETARFFRGIACFTCVDVRRGDQLTWYYGDSYQPHRDHIGYVAGMRCRDLDGLVHSRSILDSLQRVPHYCVAAIVGRSVKSDRFKVKRKRHVDSEGEESSSSSSGSGHEEAYKPRPSRFRQDSSQAGSIGA